MRGLRHVRVVASAHPTNLGVIFGYYRRPVVTMAEHMNCLRQRFEGDRRHVRPLGQANSSRRAFLRKGMLADAIAMHVPFMQSLDLFVTNTIALKNAARLLRRGGMAD